MQSQYKILTFNIQNVFLINTVGRLYENNKNKKYKD